jgi:hypothetical protein
MFSRKAIDNIPLRPVNPLQIYAIHPLLNGHKKIEYQIGFYLLWQFKPHYGTFFGSFGLSAYSSFGIFIFQQSKSH